MASDKGFNTKVPVPAGKSSMGRTVPADDGKGIGPVGSPIKTVSDNSVTAPSKPFGSGTGEIAGKI